MLCAWEVAVKGPQTLFRSLEARTLGDVMSGLPWSLYLPYLSKSLLLATCYLAPYPKLIATGGLEQQISNFSMHQNFVCVCVAGSWGAGIKHIQVPMVGSGQNSLGV